MADQPGPPADPPATQPDPPDEWRVYQEDTTPDPEPPSGPPPVQYGTPPAPPPHVPYGSTQDHAPIFVTSTPTSSVTSRLILVVIALVVLGGVGAAALAIFAAVDSGIGGIGGIDAKDPDDFAELIDKLEEDKGTTIVHDVNFYTDYIIVYMPYTDDPGDTRQISYTWRGGDLEKWTTGTSTDPTIDLATIDPEVIDGMCDSVLALADGAVPDDCYLSLSKPSEGSKTWFRASVSDEFSRYYSVEYDKNGVEVARTVP
jgi:hypothetical protein